MSTPTIPVYANEAAFEVSGDFPTPAILQPPPSDPSPAAEATPATLPALPTFTDTVMSDSHQQSPYTEYQINSRFVNQSGVIVVPSAGPDGTPPAVIKMHAAKQYRIVTWTATRVGVMPELPNPILTGSNDLLISMDVDPQAPKPYQVSNFYLYRVSGTYVYEILKPLVIGTDPIPSAVLPASTALTTQANLSNFNFKQGVIAPTVSTQQPPPRGAYLTP